MLAEQTLILIVEDEPAIIELLNFTLKQANWNPVSVNSAEDAWQFLQRRTPELILLDWMLPQQSGIELLARLRADRRHKALPVIMLTAKTMEEDKVAGLDTGADDYITKPFSPRELTSRINALLRRKLPEHAQTVMKLGALSLDPATRVVSLNGVPLEMGQSEVSLLKFLMAHPEKVFSRSQLLDKVWGDHAAIEERTVDVHVLRLRKALGEAGDMVKTVRGIGYMISLKP
ncbi:MAG: response regulator [Paucimonas sp.]|jgi:two-component system phosphate regulon response regulator PhoB|nr:response regulator [Paucimonas sp.]